jgi:hypothetical protein
MQRPDQHEYAPAFQRYTQLVPGSDLNEILRANTDEVTAFLMQIPQFVHDYAYAEGKWTIKQVIQHITDTERGMSFRAFVAARGDNTSPIPLMDEDMYARNAPVHNKPMQQLLAEFVAVRSAAALLYMGLSPEEEMRTSLVNGINTTARAWAWISIGHTLHHIQVLRDRYLTITLPS